MPLATLAAFGQSGIVYDQLPFSSPPTALSKAKNARLSDGAVAPRKGEIPAFGLTPNEYPLWLLPTQDFSGTPLLIVPTKSKVYSFNGNLRQDITRLFGGPYGTSLDLRWNGGVLGGVPVLNNGVDVPQAWPQPGVDTLIDLPAWPDDTRARIIRPFKTFLVGYNITQGASRFPFLVQWSDAADPGALPSSWDFTDPTLLAGRSPLSDESTEIVDAIPLRDVMLIYRQNSVWLQQYTADLNVFGFRRVFSDFGILSHDCAIEFGGKHLVVTNEDIIIHDGNQIKSIADGKARRFFFRELNAGRAAQTFVCQNYEAKEILVCFATKNSLYPNMALVYNYASDTFMPQDIPNLSYAVPGLVPTSALRREGTKQHWGEATQPFDDPVVAPHTVLGPWNDLVPTWQGLNPNSWQDLETGGPTTIGSNFPWNDSNVDWEAHTEAWDDGQIVTGCAPWETARGAKWNNTQLMWDDACSGIPQAPIPVDDYPVNYIWGTFDPETYEETPFFDFLDEEDVQGLVASSSAWNSEPGSWDEDQTAWESLTSFASRRILIGARYDFTGSLCLMATGRRSLGASIETVIERTHLTLKKGEFVQADAVDLGGMYLIKALYFHFLANPKKSLKVFIARHTELQKEPRWIGPFELDPQGDFKLNCLVNTRLVGLRLVSDDPSLWRLAAVSFDMQQISRF